MRKAITLTLATVAIALALPAVQIEAVCAPAPQADSEAGRRTMRASPFIVWGTIESDVPTDAHAAHSFFLRVRGFFRGIGPARIEVSDYSDGDLPVEAGRPGASVDASQTFLNRYAGQDAVVFASRERTPYTNQYSTTACTYTAYGDAAAADILPLLRSVFGAPQPPRIATTGPAGIAALTLVAALCIAAGGAMALVARPRPSRGRRDAEDPMVAGGGSL